MTMSGAVSPLPLNGQTPSLRVIGATTSQFKSWKSRKECSYHKREHSLRSNIANVSGHCVPSPKPVIASEGSGG
jgi:hypothetical protein